VTLAPILGEASGRELWYLTRATGIVALVLLTAALVLGVSSGGDWARPRWPRFVTQGLHRNVSLLAVVFVFVHVLTTVVDGYVPVGWLDAVVPFLSPYHRVLVGLGAIAFDALLALIVSSLVRPHLSHRAWRNTHLLAYAAWPIALVHGLGAGTDTATVVMRGITAACVMATCTAVAWRATRHRPFRALLRLVAVVAFGLLSIDAAVSNSFSAVSRMASSSTAASGVLASEPSGTGVV
jgi:predicted ferric reductase